MVIESNLVRDFVDGEIVRMNSYGFSVRFVDQPVVYCDENNTFPIEGYMDEDVRELVIARGDRPVNTWLHVFVHECCHVDQLVSQCWAWTQAIDQYGIDATHPVDMWLTHDIELPYESIRTYVRRIQILEGDCELRTLQKIHEHNLPIDRSWYIRYANAYLTFYSAVLHTRRWANDTSSWHDIIDVMPEHWLTPFDCERLAIKHLELYQKYLTVQYNLPPLGMQEHNGTI